MNLKVLDAIFFVSILKNLFVFCPTFELMKKKEQGQVSLNSLCLFPQLRFDELQLFKNGNRSKRKARVFIISSIAIDLVRGMR